MRPDESLLSALHESYHVKQFRELGQENYLKQSRSVREECVYNEKMLNNLYSQGYSTEDIARKMVNERNSNRLNSYIEKDDMEGYELVRKSNLQTYNNAEGPTPESLFEKYGSLEGVVNASVSSNPGMDACVGLYNIYHGGS
ncbi:Metallopeptidase toxin 4 [Bacillus sp. 491mf]|nr:Metallopeptidase toxin 4 [Bacillus sp. 491mf]